MVLPLLHHAQLLRRENQCHSKSKDLPPCQNRQESSLLRFPDEQLHMLMRQIKISAPALLLHLTISSHAKGLAAGFKGFASLPERKGVFRPEVTSLICTWCSSGESWLKVQLEKPFCFYLNPSWLVSALSSYRVHRDRHFTCGTATFGLNISLWPCNEHLRSLECYSNIMEFI